MLHAFQHIRHKPGALIEWHITDRPVFGRDFGTGRMQQMTFTAAIAGPEIEITAVWLTDRRLNGRYQRCVCPRIETGKRFIIGKRKW